MAANSTKRDLDLSEAAFHSKYGFMTGWDEAREMVHAAAQQADREGKLDVWAALEALYWSMKTEERDRRRDTYVDAIES